MRRWKNPCCTMAYMWWRGKHTTQISCCGEYNWLTCPSCYALNPPPYSCYSQPGTEPLSSLTQTLSCEIEDPSMEDSGSRTSHHPECKLSYNWTPVWDSSCPPFYLPSLSPSQGSDPHGALKALPPSPAPCLPFSPCSLFSNQSLVCLMLSWFLLLRGLKQHAQAIIFKLAFYSKLSSLILPKVTPLNL